MVFPLAELSTKYGMQQFVNEAERFLNNQLLPKSPSDSRYFIKQVFNSYVLKSHTFRPELGSYRITEIYKFRDVIGLMKYGQIQNTTVKDYDILETAGCRPLLIQWQKQSEKIESGKVYAVEPGTSYTLIATGNVVLRIHRNVTKSQLCAWQIDKFWGGPTLNVEYSSMKIPVNIMQHETSSFPATIQYSSRGSMPVATIQYSAAAAFPDSSVATLPAVAFQGPSTMPATTLLNPAKAMVPAAAFRESSTAPFPIQNASVPAATLQVSSSAPFPIQNASVPAATLQVSSSASFPAQNSSVPAAATVRTANYPPTSISRSVSVASPTPSVLTEERVLEKQPGPSAPRLNKEKKVKRKKNKKEERRKLKKVMPLVVEYFKYLMNLPSESSSDDST